MKPNYDSYYKRYSNKTTQWILGDTEKLYNHNLNHNYEMMKAQGWIDTTITYKFNSFGFRCEEFTDEPTAMFLGCSHTVGIGLPTNTIWPEIVASEINLKCANLGQGGGSPDSSFRMCHGYIDKIKPKIVFYMEPPIERFELFGYYPVPYGPWNYNHSKSKEIYKSWYSNENNAFFNQAKNLLGIKMMCTERNIKLVHVSWVDLQDDGTFARDLGHRGISAHNKFAHDLLKTI